MIRKTGVSLTAFTLRVMSIVVVSGAFWAIAQAQELPPEVVRYADLVLHNAQVLTMDREQPPINVTQAVAVRDGRILATGTDSRILRLAGPSTVTVDLEGYRPGTWVTE